MPTQTEELVKRIREIENRIARLEAWEGEPADGTRYWFIKPAWALGQPTTVGVLPVMQVIDGASSDVYFNFGPPDRFISYLALYLAWLSPAAAGNMNWEIEAQWAAAGEPYNQHMEVHAAATSATQGANIINGDQHPGGLLLTDLAVDDYVGVRVTRRADLAPDTLGDTVYIIGLVLAYRGSL